MSPVADRGQPWDGGSRPGLVHSELISGCRRAGPHYDSDARSVTKSSCRRTVQREGEPEELRLGKNFAFFSFEQGVNERRYGMPFATAPRPRSSPAIDRSPARTSTTESGCSIRLVMWQRRYVYCAVSLAQMSSQRSGHPDPGQSHAGMILGSGSDARQSLPRFTRAIVGEVNRYIGPVRRLEFKLWHD